MENLKFLKNKKNLSVIIISTIILLTGVVLGGVLVLESHQGSASQLNSLIMPKIFKKINQTSCVPNFGDKNSDIDHDGLPDWQEQLYGSNPCNPDTDGDGYPDGLEVASGYDPTKPAPNDKLVNQTQKSRGERNLTLMLAHFLSGNVITKKITPNSSSTLPTSSLIMPNIQNQKILSQGINQVIPYFKASLKIDLSAIKTIQSNQKNIDQYRQNVNTILNQTPNCYLPQGLSEAEIIYQAIQKKDFSTVNCLGDFYHQIFSEMKNLNIPSDALRAHKKQMEIFYQMEKTFYSIKGINNDPLRTYLFIENLKNIKDKILDLGQDIDKINKKYPLEK